MEIKLSEISLTDKESRFVRDKLSQIQYEPYGNNEYVTKLRRSTYFVFPDRILSLLEKQKNSHDLTPFFTINNLPIDEVIYGSPSFCETGQKYKSGTLSENIICGLASVIGEPYSINFEGMELVNNLTPQKDTKNDYTGLGSEVELDFHIENAALNFMKEGDFSPMGLMLLGIRKDPKNDGPRTFVADARLAIKQLSEEDLDALRSPNFIIRLPYRWRNAFSSKVDNTDLCPLISGPIHLPRVTVAFYPDMVLPVNSKAIKAFKNFYKAIKNISYGIHMTPGKLVYIDNRFALHSREKFIATYDEFDFPYRWLQRVFIAPNLWNFRSFPVVGDRVYDPSNSKNKLYQ